MVVLIVGAVALFIAYVLSHLVFSTQVTTKRRLAFFALSIGLLYVAVGSVVYTVQIV
ncbi:hypothetical protein [Staphylococcus equorum]|uniref:hypothetical protein n=1 Tax=Staphylococcus equorum TaxID=246432 RepID=UPI003FD7140E